MPRTGIVGTVGEEADCDNLPLTLVKQDIEGREPPLISQLSNQILTTTGLTLCSAHTEPQHALEVVTEVPMEPIGSGTQFSGQNGFIL